MNSFIMAGRYAQPWLQWGNVRNVVKKQNTIYASNATTIKRMVRLLRKNVSRPLGYPIKNSGIVRI